MKNIFAFLLSFCIFIVLDNFELDVEHSTFLSYLAIAVSFRAGRTCNYGQMQSSRVSYVSVTESLLSELFRTIVYR